MRSLRAAACAGVVLAAALSACTGAHGTDKPVSATAYDSSAILTYNETEPANPLIPGDTIEVGGIGILGALFKGLVQYDPTTGAPSYAVAQSITVSSDSRVYTITLKPGWTFQNGEPVTAQSFVNAWNYTAYSPNLMAGASYLSHIQGFSQVNNANPDGTQPATLPPAKQMSGLKVINDRTFVVTLTSPFPDFITTLGYSAFFPLPASFFSNVKAYEAHPIGDGPFEFVSYTKGKDLLVKRYDNYAGAQKARIGGIDFEFYTDLDQAYAAVEAGKLDYLSFSPWNSTPGMNFPASQRVSYRELGYQAIGFPLFEKKYDNVKFRQAVSMAVNRVSLINQIFGGVPQPADGLVPPNVQGYIPNECGELCTYQPAKAKKLFAESGFKGPITLTSNIDSGNEQWIKVVCSQLQQTFGRQCNFQPSPALGVYFTSLYTHTEKAIFRTAWVADYPAADDFLDTLFETGGSNNIEGYSNPTVNALLTRADSATSQQQGFQLYQQAERLILQDMPIIPMFYLADTAVWTPKVHNVIPTVFRELDFTNVTISK
jgi:oligopeptide transport system substrate-binding protein